MFSFKLLVATLALAASVSDATAVPWSTQNSYLPQTLAAPAAATPSTSIASITAEAQKLTSASIPNCVQALTLAAKLPVCTLKPTDLATCSPASKAVLSVLAIPCNLGPSVAAHEDSFAAGVAAAQPKSCFDEVNTAASVLKAACAVQTSTQCKDTKVQILGQISATCPFA
jgi:hypothetical protein